MTPLDLLDLTLAGVDFTATPRAGEWLEIAVPGDERTYGLRYPSFESGTYTPSMTEVFDWSEHLPDGPLPVVPVGQSDWTPPPPGQPPAPQPKPPKPQSDPDARDKDKGDKDKGDQGADEDARDKGEQGDQGDEGNNDGDNDGDNDDNDGDGESGESGENDPSKLPDPVQDQDSRDSGQTGDDSQDDPQGDPQGEPSADTADTGTEGGLDPDDSDPDEGDGDSDESEDGEGEGDGDADDGDADGDGEDGDGEPGEGGEPEGGEPEGGDEGNPGGGEPGEGNPADSNPEDGGKGEQNPQDPGTPPGPGPEVGQPGDPSSHDPSGQSPGPRPDPPSPGTPGQDPSGGDDAEGPDSGGDPTDPTGGDSGDSGEDGDGDGDDSGSDSDSSTGEGESDPPSGEGEGANSGELDDRGEGADDPSEGPDSSEDGTTDPLADGEDEGEGEGEDEGSEGVDPGEDEGEDEGEGEGEDVDPGEGKDDGADDGEYTPEHVPRADDYQERLRQLLAQRHAEGGGEAPTGGGHQRGNRTVLGKRYHRYYNYEALVKRHPPRPLAQRRALAQSVERLFDDFNVGVGFIESPRIDGRKLITELVTERYRLSAARRAEIEPPVCLILIDVSPSCETLIESSLPLINAFRKDEKVGVVTTFNGVPVEGFGAARKLPEFPAKFTSELLEKWWLTALRRLNVSGVLAWGDDDAEATYLQIGARVPVIWMDDTPTHGANNGPMPWSDVRGRIAPFRVQALVGVRRVRSVQAVAGPKGAIAALRLRVVRGIQVTKR